MAKLTEKQRMQSAQCVRPMSPLRVKPASPMSRLKARCGSLMTNMFYLADVASPRTIAKYQRENPQVAILCLDAATHTGCRIWAKGEIITSGELFDKTAAMLASRNMKICHVVKVTVEEYRPAEDMGNFREKNICFTKPKLFIIIDLRFSTSLINCSYRLYMISLSSGICGQRSLNWRIPLAFSHPGTGSRGN